MCFCKRKISLFLWSFYYTLFNFFFFILVTFKHILDHFYGNISIFYVYIFHVIVFYIQINFSYYKYIF